MKIRKAMRIVRGRALRIFIPGVLLVATVGIGGILRHGRYPADATQIHDRNTYANRRQITCDGSFPTPPFWLQTAMRDWKFFISDKLKNSCVHEFVILEIHDCIHSWTTSFMQWRWEAFLLAISIPWMICKRNAGKRVLSIAFHLLIVKDFVLDARYNRL